MQRNSFIMQCEIEGSIIIGATYNRANYIELTSEFIKCQIFNNLECLIIDYGSTDNTTEILKAILEKDGRIKYYIRNQKHKIGSLWI